MSETATQVVCRPEALRRSRSAVSFSRSSRWDAGTGSVTCFSDDATRRTPCFRAPTPRPESESTANACVVGGIPSSSARAWRQRSAPEADAAAAAADDEDDDEDDDDDDASTASACVPMRRMGAVPARLRMFSA